jgi:predicted nicotinamide N-methyase
VNPLVIEEEDHNIEFDLVLVPDITFDADKNSLLLQEQDNI